MLQKGAIYWAAALGVAAAVGAAGAVWRYSPLPQTIAPPQASAPSASTASALPIVKPAGPTGPSTVASANPQQQSAATAPAAPAPKAAEPSAEKDLQRPQFDIVRVEPTGEAVIAGHAAPKAKVAITDQGRIVAEATADDAGQFAILPPTFAPGGHNLGLSASVDGGKPVEVAAPVAIDVPQPVKLAGPPKLASTSPTSVAGAGSVAPPSKALASTAGSSAIVPSSAAPAKPAQTVVAARGDAPTEANASRPHVIVSGVAVEDAGRLVVTGAASAGAFVNLYLNGSFLANVVAGKDGRWSLTVQHGMKGGAYAIRADEVDRAKDSVISRAEVPFNYPERVANQALARKAPPVADAPLSPIVPSASAPQPSKVSPPPAGAPPSAAIASAPPAMTPAPTPAKTASTTPNAATATEPPPPSMTANDGRPASTAAMSSAPVAPAPLATTPAAPPAKAGSPAPTTQQPAQTLAAAAPAAALAAPSQPTALATNASPANAIVREVDTTKVVRGDSLWRISSQHYGNGVRYKQIYAANSSQIRNPRLIYPGQIFVLPQPTPF